MIVVCAIKFILIESDIPQPIQRLRFPLCILRFSLDLQASFVIILGRRVLALVFSNLPEMIKVRAHHYFIVEFWAIFKL